HQPSAISHQPSAISHQPSARGSSIVGIGLISVQKRLSLANTSRTNSPLIFCFLSLLLILSSKSAIAYEPASLLQGTVVFQATPILGACICLNWNDLPNEEYYSLQKNGDLIAFNDYSCFLTAYG
ncbi:hypothetical protein KKG56_06400, partial [bacterium]|nr:hypothetical protein [bacterium]